MRYSIFLAIIFCSCTYNELILEPVPVCKSDNPTFLDCVQPIIDHHCLGCHSSASANGDLSNYDVISSSIMNGDLIDRVQRNEGELGFMPMGANQLNELDIQILMKWKNNGAPNN